MENKLRSYNIFAKNSLLFEKLQNECKNSSFLQKVTCIRSDHVGAVAKFHIHGFEMTPILRIKGTTVL